jgi:hypothetical protein
MRLFMVVVNNMFVLFFKILPQSLTSRYNTDSRSKLCVHFVKNSLFSRRDNKRRHAV